MYTYEPLSDMQWAMLEPIMPNPIKKTRGKPHSPWRAVLDSVLFVLLTGAKWGSWPKNETYASKSAAHRWYLHWEKTGFLEQVLQIVHKVKPDAKVVEPNRRIHDKNRGVITHEEIGEELPNLFEVDKPQMVQLGA